MQIKLAIAIQCACLLVATGANAQNVSGPQFAFETYDEALSFLFGTAIIPFQPDDCRFVPDGNDPNNPDLTILEDNESGLTPRPGPIGPNLSRHCQVNVDHTNKSGGSVIGGSLSSLQSTRTVSQFDISRRPSEPCDPSEDPDCAANQNGPVSNYMYPGNLSQTDHGFFSLVDDGEGILNANALIPFDGFSVFGQVEYEDYRQSATIYEPESDVDVFTAELGAMWNLSQNSIIGLKGIFSTADGVSQGSDVVTITGPVRGDDGVSREGVFTGNFQDICGVPSDGTIDTDEFGGSIFYQGTLLQHGFITAELGASKGRVNYSNSLCTIPVSDDGAGELIPSGDETAGIISGSPDAFGLSADIKAGYDWEYSGLAFGPRLSLNGWWQSVDEYSETEEPGSPNPFTGDTLPITGASLRYQDQDISSFQTRVGFAVSKPFIFDRTTVVPFAQLDYIHEFANDQRTIKASFVEDGRPDPLVFSFKTNPPDRDFFELRGGVVAEVFDGGVAYFDGRVILGNELIDNVGVTAGLRVAF